EIRNDTLVMNGHASGIVSVNRSRFPGPLYGARVSARRIRYGHAIGGDLHRARSPRDALFHQVGLEPVIAALPRRLDPNINGCGITGSEARREVEPRMVPLVRGAIAIAAALAIPVIRPPDVRLVHAWAGRVKDPTRQISDVHENPSDLVRAHGCRP